MTNTTAAQSPSGAALLILEEIHSGVSLVSALTPVFDFENVLAALSVDGLISVSFGNVFLTEAGISALF